MYNMSATMGQGLSATRNSFGGTNGLTSPKNVISSARADIVKMNNTVTEGMSKTTGLTSAQLSVTGARKDGWDNPNSTARNGLHMRDNNLTIQDIVDNVLKKPAFGFEGYNPKAVVKDLLPVKTHAPVKAKRRMFCEEASRAKDKVPSPTKYQSAIDWNKNPTSRNIKFYSDARMMVADEIIKKSKNPAKTSPGPTGHDHYDAWKKTLKKVPGNYKNNDARITFVQ